MPSEAQGAGKSQAYAAAFKVGTPVWVKFENVWQPARIVNRAETIDDLERDPGVDIPPESEYNRMVEFFDDDNQVAVIDVLHMVEYVSSVDHLHGPEQFREDLLPACEEANAYVERQLDSVYNAAKKRSIGNEQEADQERATKKQKTVGAYRQAQAAAMKVREASKNIESVSSTLKNDLGAGISDLQNSIGDLRQLVADNSAMDHKRKAFEDECERTRSMLEKMLRDMSLLQQASKETCLA